LPIYEFDNGIERGGAFSPAADRRGKMFGFERIREMAGKVAEARRRRHTQRVVESLPPEIRKDIGWID